MSGGRERGRVGLDSERMKIRTDYANGNEVESRDAFCGQREVSCGVRAAVVAAVVETNADDEDDVILVGPLPLVPHHSSVFAQVHKTSGAWRGLGAEGAADDVKVTALAYRLLTGQNPCGKNTC